MAATYQGFIALRNTVDEFPPAGCIYTKPKVDKKTIMDAEYVVIASREVDEYADEEGGRIPGLLVDRPERDEKAPIADIVDAVFYYEEYDAFKYA